MNTVQRWLIGRLGLQETVDQVARLDRDALRADDLDAFIRGAHDESDRQRGPDAQETIEAA